MRRLLKRFHLPVAGLAAAALAVSAVAAGSTTATAASQAAPTMNIVDTAAAAANLKTFVSLLKTSGLDKMLAASGGSYTVFAPSDDAFAKLPKATLDQLESNPSLLKATLLYHMLPGETLSPAAVTMSSAITLDAAKVGLSVVGGSLYVGDAKVLTPDTLATNGVLDVIDTVLAPPGPVMSTDKRAAYCAAAGDTTVAGKPIPAGKFLNLAYQQPTWDFHYTGATVAIYVDKMGLTCAAPPTGYTLKGTAPDELHVPGGLYPYYVK